MNSALQWNPFVTLQGRIHSAGSIDQPAVCVARAKVGRIHSIGSINPPAACVTFTG
jgi:hypothetical protein